MALQELRVNKLRTFLSLFGITIGIFCIIGVLATVDSLQQKVQNDVNSLGSNTVYIAKFAFGESEDGTRPWWKYEKRPQPTYAEMQVIKEKSFFTANACMFIGFAGNLDYNDKQLSTQVYAVSDEFNSVQTIEVEHGRYIASAEFNRGMPVVILGNENATNLFGKPERAVGKQVSDRKSTRLNSSHITISYAVFCLKKKKNNNDS